MRMARLIRYATVAIAFTFVGLWLGHSERGRSLTQTAHHAAVGAVARKTDLSIRTRVLLENPEIVRALARGGGFGGKMSPAVAQNMFSRDPDAIEDARAELEVIEVAPRTWHIRLPIVNAVLFETDAGLVLVDTGMGPAGPAIVDAMRQVSDSPLHSVIYTHGHVDHAYGTWAIIEAGMQPEIIAHERLPARTERYIRLRESIARYMSQPEEQLPMTRDDFVWPTRTFRDRLELTIGGEQFVLVHHPAETDDQLYVWVPGRKVLATADYYQGFLPNAGNGKRVQRYVEEWAAALREMAALEPQAILPAHGAAIMDPAEIQEVLGVHAEALQYVVDATIEGLNSGLRKDQVFQSLELPEHLANHPALGVQYVTARDISKMVIKRYTGWWDDLPSHWTPAPIEREAATIARLAGGVPALVAEARRLSGEDVQLACHLADWAWLAAPDDPSVQQLVIDTYLARIIDPRSNTQEILAYIDAITAARSRQLAAGT
jgi:glyoxylase-like metal-dependent hydrolase (beta-lactamase superfamily II)